MEKLDHKKQLKVGDNCGDPVATYRIKDLVNANAPTCN